MTRLRLLLLITMAACAVIACGGGATTSTDKAPGRAAATTASVADPAQAVVEVQGDYGDHRTSATGFVYDAKHALVLAPDHAVEGARSVLVTLADGTPVHGQVLARAMCHDLAVMRLAPQPTGLGAMRFTNAGVRKGSVVASLDIIGGDRPSVRRTAGIVSAVGVSARLNARLPPFTPLISHYSPLTASSSGSPLVDGSGQVIGVNTMVAGHYGMGTRRGFVYALASEEVTTLLGELRSGKGKTTYEGWDAEHRCHEQMDEIIGVKGRMGGNDMDMGRMG